MVFKKIRDGFAALEQANADLAQRIELLESRLENLNYPKMSARLDLLEYRTSSLAASYNGDYYRKDAHASMQEYWTAHNVTGHAAYASVEESLNAFQHRNSQYPGYLELMPVSGQDRKVVLDYGCGPGNDLVGFAHYSKPGKLIGIDISTASLDQARKRLDLHGAYADLVHVPYGSYELPLDDESVDYLHCSGVLMLLEDPVRLLHEFRRVLRPGGELRLMVYHYDSIWLHLYVAYVLQLEHGIYADVDVRRAFSRTTDGEYCPHVDVWSAEDMSRMAEQTGFSSEFIGAAPSLWELHLLPLRFKAALNPSLSEEHRAYLMSLTFDVHGFPLYQGRRTGIDGCYRFLPIS